jgi:hypothetical protein
MEIRKKIGKLPLLVGLVPNRVFRLHRREDDDDGTRDARSSLTPVALALLGSASFTEERGRGG